MFAEAPQNCHFDTGCYDQLGNHRTWGRFK
jgi:hypothetical protein